MGDIADELGISGKQGEYFRPDFSNKALETLQNRNQLYSRPNAKVLSDAIAAVRGGKSIEDAIADTISSTGGEVTDELRDKLATGSTTGSLFASREVADNPILGQLFGQDGALSRATAEERDLASRGFQLKPEDIEAYGQASGNIARLFGQQEQGLTEDLARRGLASGASGAAGVAFSGLQGNRNEQLAAAQRQIAEQRMQNNLQRLGQTRQFVSQLGGQAENAIQGQFGRQLAGAQNTRSGLERSAELQQAMNNARANAELASAQDKRAAKAPSIGEAFGSGLMSSATSFGKQMGDDASGQTGRRYGEQMMSSGGGGGGGGGGMMGLFSMFSDKRAKTNIQRVDTTETLNNLVPYSFNYKWDQKSKPSVGIMAQDLEKTPEGASMVIDQSGMKAIDLAKAVSFILASLGDINKRLNQLEAR